MVSSSFKEYFQTFFVHFEATIVTVSFFILIEYSIILILLVLVLTNDIYILILTFCKMRKPQRNFFYWGCLIKNL